MQHYSGEPPALSTLSFQSKRPGPRAATQSSAQAACRQSGAGNTAHRPAGARDPNMSFLTATTLIYAIGAGITAAAGTRLALQ